MYRRNSFLPFSPPLISQAEIDSVIETLRSGWITTGPKTRKFETAFSDYIGAPAALALSSCTAGLHISLLALGIGPGDEVITTPMTFAASVNVIEHVGARPVLVDVEPDTLTIDPSLIEPALTPSTKAILAVHYAGHPAGLDFIRGIQKSRHLSLIEDAAHSLPAEYKGDRIGSGDNPVSFSFYATKNLTTGEGGMLTGSSDFLDKARIISLHGMSKDAWRRYDRTGSWYYEVVLPGFKYNMTDIQAAIGLEQLRRIDTFQNRRRKIVEQYNQAFADNDVIELPTTHPDVSHAWHLYVIRLHLDALQIDRNRFIEEMTNRNIGTSVHFIPIHLHPYYRDRYHYCPTDFPIAYAHYQRMISLPLNPSMSNHDAGDVIEAVLDVIRTYRR